MNTSHATKNEDVYYQQHYWLDAEKHYKSALIPLEKAWKLDRNNLDLFLSWVNCMHSLAEAYAHQSESEKAFYHLVTPHNWLIDKLHDDTLNQSEIREIIAAMRVTFAPLYAYSLKKPCCENCTDTLKATQAWLKQSDRQRH